ncbi:MAG: RDD family protein, partial [Chloroflexi bacterium]
GFIIGIPLVVIGGLIAIVTGGLVASSGSNDQSANNAAAAGVSIVFALFYLVAFVVSIGYWVYFWGTSGSTFGMKMLKLQVVDANTGAPIGIGRALVRWLMTLVNTWACYLGWIWVAIDVGGPPRLIPAEPAASSARRPPASSTSRGLSASGCGQLPAACLRWADGVRQHSLRQRLDSLRRSAHRWCDRRRGADRLFHSRRAHRGRRRPGHR